MIAHVVYRCVPGTFRGGVERVVLELADAQARAGRKVEVFAFTPTARADAETPGGARIRYFPGRSFGDTVSSPAMMKTLAAERERLSLLHCHNTFHPLNVETRRLATRLRLPLFIHPHGALDQRLFGGRDLKSIKKRLYIRLVERQNLHSAAAIFALSDEEEVQLRSLGVTSPVEVVPNGIALPPERDDRLRREARAELGISEDDPVVLYLGRIVAKKGLHDIVKAIAIARRSAPLLKLLIVGNPEQDEAYTARLRRDIDEPGLGQAVRWLGFANEDQKRPLLSAADIFIHASYSEGMAMAVLEAMGAGLPTVVTRGCYMGAAAAAAALVETKQSPEALAEALSTLIGDRARMAKLGTAARAYVGENHSWASLARGIEDVYERYSGLNALGGG